MEEKKKKIASHFKSVNEDQVLADDYSTCVVYTKTTIRFSVGYMQFSFYDDPFLRIVFTFHRRCQIFGIRQMFMGFLQQLVKWYII